MNRFSSYLLVLMAAVLVGYIYYNESRFHANKAPVGFNSLPPPEFISEYRNAVSLDLPEKLTFAEEEVPLHIPDVRERLDRELHINTYWHSSTIFLLKRGNKWLPRMEKILRENGIPDDFKYLTAIEGGFVNAVSPKNAVGFWQILKHAGRENGLEINNNVDERYDPLKSTRAACHYLTKAHNKFGNWTSAAASYNRGMAGLARAMENQKADSYYDLLLNEETSRYVFRILAIKEIFQNPSEYGFDIDDEHLYRAEELTFVKVSSDVKDLVAFARQHGINYKLLKLHNPWLRQDHLDVKKGKTYSIAIASGSRSPYAD